MIDQIMTDAPHGARIIVAGVCMEPDRIQPFVGVSKELQLQFVVAYQPAEFASTLRAIAEGELDVAPLITGRVGFEGVAEAFEELSHPEAHAKILVEPGAG
jgi:threonine dehydrogenase-like Zn-dependent dehydrogenase